MDKELYLCFYLTENEHDLLEHELRRQCVFRECDMIYYRKLKDGHVPCYREMKLIGPSAGVNRITAWLQAEKYLEYSEKNPYKTTCEHGKSMVMHVRGWCNI